MSNSSNAEPGGITWVVVADASRAEIYMRQKRHSPLEVVQNLAEPRARAKEQDLTADGPGRTFDSGGQGRHALEPGHGAKEHLQTTFAHRIAGLLESGRKAGRYKHLIIVAAPALLGELRATLGEATRTLVAAEYAKDLAGHSPATVAELIDAND